MSKTLKEILDMTWQQQAEELRHLSQVELEILFFEMCRTHPSKEMREAFERFHIAVLSVIRDRRERKNLGGNGS